MATHCTVFTGIKHRRRNRGGQGGHGPPNHIHIWLTGGQTAQDIAYQHTDQYRHIGLIMTHHINLQE